MTIAKLTAAQLATIKLAREHASKEERQAVKRELFAQVKAQLGIPEGTKLTVVSAATSPNYGALKLAKTETFIMLGADGRWAQAAPQPSAAPAKRWFKLTATEAADALTDAAIGGNDDWDDGLVYLPASSDGSEHTHICNDVQVDPDGTVYVALEEADL